MLAANGGDFRSGSVRTVEHARPGVPSRILLANARGDSLVDTHIGIAR